MLVHDPEEEPQVVRAHTGVLPETAGFHDRDTARRHLRLAIAMSDADDDPDALLDRVGIESLPATASRYDTFSTLLNTTSRNRPTRSVVSLVPCWFCT